MGLLFKSLEDRKAEAEMKVRKLENRLSKRRTIQLFKSKEKADESNDFYRGKKVGKFGVY